MLCLRSQFTWMLLVLSGGCLLMAMGCRRGSADKPAATKIENAAVAGSADEVRTQPVLWDHLPDVDRFVLTDQNGADFDSRSLNGKPMVVSFFFASCPSFCRSLNNELHRLNQAARSTDVQFVTITVDPGNDTVEVLRKYADGYDAEPDRWAFLTGSQNRLIEVGEYQFNVPIDPATHTDYILLIDKWGRYRDRFKWSDPNDTKRFLEVVQEVSKETQPPLGQEIQTRNLMAGVDVPNLTAIPWIKDFHLRNADGEPFFSRKMTGTPWLVVFAFDKKTAIGRVEELKGTKLGQSKIVLVTDDPGIATAVNKAAREALLQDVTTVWGDSNKVVRIAREYFGWNEVDSDEGQSSPWFLVDRWGEVRLTLPSPVEHAGVMSKLEELKSESKPMAPEFGFYHSQSESQSNDQ